MKAMTRIALCVVTATIVCGLHGQTAILKSPSELAAEQSVSEAPVGPEIFGVFRGRTPCRELSAHLNVPAADACNKVKCRLILYQDPQTRQPTTYVWVGKTRLTNTWSVQLGTKTDPRAVIYKLNIPDPAASLSLQAVDPNILLVLSRDGTPLVGNKDFSYTLNRIIRTTEAAPQ